MNRLTPKQRAFCNHYLATQGNAPEAALRAFDCSSRNSARVMACKTLKLPKVRQALKLAMAQLDLPEKAIQALAESMKATKHVKTGSSSEEVPDHLIRIRAATFHPRPADRGRKPVNGRLMLTAIVRAFRPPIRPPIAPNPLISSTSV